MAHSAPSKKNIQNKEISHLTQEVTKTYVW